MSDVINPQSALKVVLVGNQSNGKTSILNRVVENFFVENYEQTVTNVEKDHLRTVRNTSKKVFGRILDIAGHDTQRDENIRYYRGADAAVVCVNVNKVNNDDNDGWLDALNDWGMDVLNESPNCKLYLTGTQCDKCPKAVLKLLKEDANKAKYEFSQGSVKGPYITSSKEDIGLGKLFDEIYKDFYVDQGFKLSWAEWFRSLFN